MKTISQLLSDSDSSKSTINLGRVTSPEGQPASERETPRDDRVDAARLERAWRRIPVLNNGVNKMTQMIMSKNWKIEGENEEFFQDFIDDVGKVGSVNDFNEILETIFRYQIIYGEHYIELVEAEEDDSIVDLAMIDPKRMDYAKRRDNKILLDRFSNPVGYVQELPYGYRRQKPDQIHEIPDNVNLKPTNEIFFPRDRIAHFKLYTYGEGFYPVGLIEPGFLAAERSFKFQEDFSENIENLFPMRYALVGDEMHEPTPDEIDEVLGQLQQANSKKVSSLPYHVQLKVLEAENPESMLEFFEYFDEEMIKGLGIPKSIAQGEATRVNRASLQSQIRVWEVTMMDIINRTTNNIEKQIFEPVAEAEGFEEYPDFKFQFEVDPRHQIERATRFRGDVNPTQPSVGEGGGQGGEYPDIQDRSDARSQAISAMEVGISPAEIGIMPGDVGLDEEDWEDVSVEDIEEEEEEE